MSRCARFDRTTLGRFTKSCNTTAEPYLRRVRSLRRCQLITKEIGVSSTGGLSTVNPLSVRPVSNALLIRNQTRRLKVFTIRPTHRNEIHLCAPKHKERLSRQHPALLQGPRAPIRAIAV